MHTSILWVNVKGKKLNTSITTRNYNQIMRQDINSSRKVFIIKAVKLFGYEEKPTFEFKQAQLTTFE